MAGAFPAAPFLAGASDSFLVVYKPPGLHSCPLKKDALGGGPEGESVSGEQTLLGWCARSFPEITGVRGHKPWEGGLLHRLDCGTAGLALVARNQAAYGALEAAQKAGSFAKEYTALAAAKAAETPPSMPAPPFPAETLFKTDKCPPLLVESGFRAYGPGRKAVRPVPLVFSGEKPGKRALKETALDQGQPYRTWILGTEAEGEWLGFRVRICRGFRHQVRCHLAWLGFPLANDALYGGAPRPGYPGIALLAEAISFPDPITGAVREYRLGAGLPG
ncbi:MAG: RNA pseudouridine synthase [Spirochaetaceae bacterium]|jgi:23S rRNA pseudouridine1911/1915/1917 synthase|nr:RNA pseudouridine synthase [Spirochaetaceae bacterium]